MLTDKIKEMVKKAAPYAIIAVRETPVYILMGILVYAGTQNKDQTRHYIPIEFREVSPPNKTCIESTDRIDPPSSWDEIFGTWSTHKGTYSDPADGKRRGFHYRHGDSQSAFWLGTYDFDKILDTNNDGRLTQVDKHQPKKYLLRPERHSIPFKKLNGKEVNRYQQIYNQIRSSCGIN